MNTPLPEQGRPDTAGGSVRTTTAWTPTQDRFVTLRSLLTPDVGADALTSDLYLLALTRRVPLDNLWDLAIYALSLGVEARTLMTFLIVHIELSRAYPELTA